MTVTAAAGRLPRQLARWAAWSRLSAGALTGIGFACGCCAAVWFTAGTPAGRLAGAAALTAWCLAQSAARRVAVARRARHSLAAADGWLAAGCAMAVEFAAYGALAAGLPAAQQRGIWPLAAAAMILLAFRRMAALCQGRTAGLALSPGSAVPASAGPAPAGPVAPGPSWPAAEAAADGGASPVTPARLAWWLLGLPAPARVVLISVTALAWGPRVTFLALLGWGAAATVASLARRLTAASPSGLPGCRGDGPIARRAGWLAHGQLNPLPPAVAGLAATSLLAVVGLRGLSGVVMLAPVAAMLLAAPGAGHPHDGRLDWLVPPALQAGQYIYLAALGFAAGVPGPLTFALVCVIALRHLDVAYRARHQMGWRPRYAGAGLGWEGRMLAAGVAALLGIATFAYLVLTAYLGVLLGWICLSSWYAVREGVRG